MLSAHCSVNCMQGSLSRCACFVQALEETTVENNKIEHEVALLRTKVHGEMKRSKSAPSLVRKCPLCARFLCCLLFMKVDNIGYFCLLFELTCRFHFWGLVKLDGPVFIYYSFFYIFYMSTF